MSVEQRDPGRRRRGAVGRQARGLLRSAVGDELYEQLVLLRARGLVAAEVGRATVGDGLRGVPVPGRGRSLRREPLPGSQLTPRAATDAAFHHVASLLDASGVEWWYVRDLPGTPHVVAVDVGDRRRALAALAGSEPGWCAALPVPVAGRFPLTAATRAFADRDAVRVFRPQRGPGMTYGPGQGCDVEFWSGAATGAPVVVAPREHLVAAELPREKLTMVDATVAGRTVRMPRAFDIRTLDHIGFPIDVVYTWVDSADPQWRADYNATRALVEGTEHHPEASHPARFRSRDKLRYSLRSIEMFAPWVNTIHLVTSGQTPAWLVADHPRLRVVPHAQIMDAADLPTFNSNAIISRLHHIPDLAEHYIYFNDDVMLSRPVEPTMFFTPSGLALVSPSSNLRPLGASTADDEPHVNLTRNIRALIEDAFGVTVTRAIKHTPHPQLRSVHHELEGRFPEAYRRTWASRFRHHDDIVADQFFHYYAQVVGRAVPGRLRYAYLNVLDRETEPVMEALLHRRHREAFCLNDAPVEGAVPMEHEDVMAFLDGMLPRASSFEA